MQNRERVFITGVRNSGRRLKGIRLATVADVEVEKKCNVGLLSQSDNWEEIDRRSKRFPNWGIALNGRVFCSGLGCFSEAMPRGILKDVLEPKVSSRFDFTESTIARLKDSTRVRRFVSGVEILSNQGGGARMGYTVFGVNGLAPTLTCTASRHYERYRIQKRYRRLTNVEYARLQGFPDDHCDSESVYSQYALFGNAVPPPMAKWVIEKVVSSNPVKLADLPKRIAQKRLFADAVE